MTRFFTELFEPGNDERKKDSYLVLITEKPFPIFKAEVYGAHMAVHPCVAVDIDGKVTRVDKNTSPMECILTGLNMKIIGWTAMPLPSPEEVKVIFQEICENNNRRISESKEAFGL